MKIYRIGMFALVVVFCFIQFECSNFFESFTHLAPKTILKHAELIANIDLTSVFVFIEGLADDKTNHAKSLVRNDKLDVQWISHQDMNIAPINTAKQVRKVTTQLIKQAQKEILIEMNKLNDPKVWAALLKRAKEGVEVKIIVGAARSLLTEKELSHYQDMMAVAKEIKTLEIISYDIKKETGKVVRNNVFPVDNHRKLVIVDGLYTHVGSCNIEAWYENKSSGLLLHSPRESAKFRQFFRNTWAAQKNQTEKISNLTQMQRDDFSILHEKSVVSNVKFNIVYEMLKAKKHIYIAQWGFTDKLLIELLIAKKRLNPKMDIKVVLNPTTVGFGTLASKVPYLKNLPTYLKLKKAGVDVRWGGDGTNSVPEDYEHRKSIVCDDIVITGSADGWKRGLEVNAELSVSVDNPQLADHFAKEIQEIWVKDLSKARYSKPVQYVSTVLVHHMHAAKGAANRLKRTLVNLHALVDSFLRKSINFFMWDFVQFEYFRSIRNPSLLPLYNGMLNIFRAEGDSKFLESASVFLKKEIFTKVRNLTALVRLRIQKARSERDLMIDKKNIHNMEFYISVDEMELETAKVTGMLSPAVDWKNKKFGLVLKANHPDAYYENILNSLFGKSHSIVAGKISPKANLLIMDKEEEGKFRQWAKQYEITDDESVLLPTYVRFKGCDGYVTVDADNRLKNCNLFDESVFELSHVIDTTDTASKDINITYAFHQGINYDTGLDEFSSAHKMDEAYLISA